VSSLGRRRLLVPALLLLAAGQPISVFAQPEGAPTGDVPVAIAPAAAAAPEPAQPAAPAPSPEPAPASEPPAATAPAPIVFNFKDTPFEQVLDFMARQTGLPVIREAEAPKTGLTFIGASEYTLDESMDVLNRLLFMHGVQLRREDRYLLLTKAEDMRAFGQVVGKIPESIGSAEVITTVVPLNNAVAAPIAEQLKGMLSKFGGITALPQQNAIILVDTAAQCRRLRAVIEQLDAERPRDSEFKLFALKHAQADKVHAALKGLIAERKQVTFVDAQGRKTTVQDDQIEGLSIQPDARTNSIIAIGPKPRLDVVGELVALLDQPDGGSDGREMLTFALAGVAADEAAASVSRLFQQQRGEGARPTVLPLPAQGKLTVIGSAEQLSLVAALIAEVDPGAAPTASAEGAPSAAQPETRTTVLRLKHLTAPVVQNLVSRLLSTRQSSVLRFAQAVDNKSLVVSGPAADVAAFEKLILGLDVPAERVQEARQVRIAAGEPAQVLAKADAMYKQSSRAELEPVAASLENESRMVTLVGSVPAIAAFTDLLRSVESSIVVERETRSIVLKQARPSQVLGRLAQLSRTLLEPTDGSAYVEPRFDAIDETRTLLVRARPQDLGAIESLVASIDGATLRDASFRVLMVPTDAIEQVRTRAADIYREQTELLPGAMPVEVIVDADRGALLLSGDAEGIARYARIVEELSRLAAKPVVKVLELKFVEAAPTAAALNQALAPMGGVGPSGGRIAISSAEGSNALVISGAATDVQMIEEIAQSLDLEGNKPGAVNVATVPLKHARAEVVAPIVQQLLQREQPNPFAQFRPGQRIPPAALEQARTLVPVKVAADRRLNVVVVSGPRESVEIARQVVADLDVDVTQSAGGLPRIVRLITLQNADANETAQSVQAIFQDEAGAVTAEQPPVVRVDRASNSLVVRGTSKQLESIEELVTGLDRATNAASRDMRLISVDRSKADAAMLAEALRRLLEQRAATKVEVISVEQLLAPTSDKKQGSDSRPVGDVVPADRTGGGTQVHALAAWIAAAAVGMPQQAAAEEGVTIAVDPLTNSLIISGSTRAVDRAIALAAELQRQMPAEPLRLRIVTLPEGVDANVIASLVNQTAGQIGQATAQNPGGFTSRVSVQPDPQGGAVIVSANDTDFGTLGELIAAVSKPMPGSTLTIKVYPLTNTTAGRVQRAVADLFQPAPRGRQAQRVLQLAFDGGPSADGRSLRVDPATVRVTADPGGRSLIVAAPSDAMPLIDRFVSLLDQAPMQDQLALRRFPLTNARAEQITPMMQQAFEAARQASPDAPRASLIADSRTNALLVTGTDAQHKDAARLLEQLDLPAEADGTEVAILPLKDTRPSTAQRLIEAAIVGNDPAKRDKLRITAADESNLLVVRAPKEMLEEARRIVAQVDSAEITGLPVRTIKLSRADAESVAQALQRLYDDRARASSKPNQPARQRQVAVIGDRLSGSLVVAASDEDFAQIQSLADTFDTPSPRQDLQFRVISLSNARVAEIRETIEGVVDEVKFPPGYWSGRGSRRNQDDTLAVQFNDRSNSIVLFGQGDAFDTIERVVKALDIVQPVGARSIVKAFKLRNANAQSVGAAIQTAMTTPGWSPWRGTDPDGVRVEIDRQNGVLLMVGREDRVDQALKYATDLDSAADVADRSVESITLTYANADRMAQSLTRFFQGRDRGLGIDRPSASIIGSQDGNVLIVAASPEDMAQIRGFVAQMDQPEENEGRTRELYRLKNAEANEIAGIIREQFPRTLASREGLVIVTPQAGTNSIIISAPRELFAKVDALLNSLDAPPLAENSRIVTVTLAQARAEDVAQSLTAALPTGVKVKVTAVRRTNTLLLTGSDEAVSLVMEQIAKLDETPPKAQTEFRRIVLQHQDGYDIASTLRTVLSRRRGSPSEPEAAVSTLAQGTTLLVSATPDQLDEILKIIKELDVAQGGKRVTEFIPLKFADPEATARALEVFYGRFAAEASTPGARAVSVIANPASKSLVIAAGEAEWPGISALLEKLDSEEYDTSRRLEIVALKHADAASLSRALSEAFAAPIRAEIERERARRQPQQPRRGDDQFPDFPTVILSNKEVVSVTAEPLTNSLVIAGPRDQTERIKAVAQQLDVPAYSQMPEPKIIALTRGPASTVAATLRQLFVDQLGGSGGARPIAGRSVLIVGDDRSNVLVVRADEGQFAQIKAMADSLQQEGDRSQVSVRVVRIRNFPVARVLQTVRTTFAPVAQQAGETLTVEIDRTGNNLVVASSERIFEQVKNLVAELDVLSAPADGPEGPSGAAPLNQGVVIIDLEHHTPQQMQQVLEQMGLTRPQPADRPGVVAEPVTIVPLTSRRAIAVIAGPQDGASVQSLVKTLDVQPGMAEQHVVVIRLKVAPAGNVAAAIEGMLKPRTQDSQIDLASSLAEQVRRLTVHRSEVDKANLTVDLSKPISILPEPQTNSLVLASTEANVVALAQVVEMLDKLPLGEAVTVRFFPLQNASATRLAAVIRGIFDQGDRLRTNPGTTIRSQPTSETGKALTGQVAISIDERTNSMIVAGREEAVALVEVMVKQLDSEKTTSWIEPRVIKLEHADPARLATTIRQVLLENAPQTPDSEALQRQIARYRILADGGDPADVQGMIQADRFAPLSTLLVVPEPTLRAVIVVGSRANAEAVGELVKLLDVPAAAAENSVRIFSLKVAAADRVATILRDIFRGQVQSGALLPQDDLVISSDLRTNALVISTSARSFAIVDQLVSQLDSDASGPTVGLTVIPVPRGDVTQLAPKVERLMRDRIEAQRRGGGIANPSDTLSIQADVASRSLVVAASAENVEIIRGLVEELVKGGESISGLQTVDVVPVRSARVEDISQAVQTLYVEKQNLDRGSDSVRVTPDLRANALIVRGTPDDIQAVRTLVERLDNASVAAVTEIKRIELLKADAGEVVRLLQNVLAGRPIAGSGVVGARKAQVLRFLRSQTAADLAEGGSPAPTEAEISGAIQEQVTLTAELRTNSIVAVAPARLMVLIESLVADLDSTVAGARLIKTFRLQNADAQAMAEVLRDLFNLRQNGSTLVLVPGRAEDAGIDVPIVGGDGSLFPSLDERQQLAITIDPRTNTLLVSGTPEYLERVGQVVNDLDSIEANEREQLVFELRNAKAAEVATTLREYFQEQSAQSRQILGADRSGSLLRMLEREVTVQGDTPSNRLVVGVSPQYRETVEKLVRELDSTPPQVMIQVLLAEVTIDSESTWGMDISVGPFGGDMYGVRSLGAGASVITALGVPNLSVSSSDFELLIRALESQGRLEVLSRPQILVNNNELARIQVGENVAIVESVERRDNGNTLANVTREDVGIILNVTPTISADGFVRMDITPTISNLSARTTQVTEDFQAPIITKREIETNVRVRDGETVVIGGLLQTTDEERRTKVPLLGDIPFIGEAFKSKRRTHSRTELLVLLTPRVIHGGEDESANLRVLTEREVGRLAKPDRIRMYINPPEDQPEPAPMPLPRGSVKDTP
jgi:type II secretion system protein D